MSEFHPTYVLNGIFYGLMGLLLFFFAFQVLIRLAPCPVWKEIVENKNLALAVLIGAISVGLCSIIAAAVH